MNTSNRILRIVPVVALAGLGLVVVGVPPSQAGDPFVAGARSTRAVDQSVVQADGAKARGRELAAALGLPGVSQRAERLEDRFEHRTYDEVTSLDAAGHEVAVARFDPDGRVAMAVALGWRTQSGRTVDGRAAADRAAALARAAGLSIDGPPLVRASAGAGGWSVAWPRIVDGVPVRGDGIRIALWPDGSFHGLSRTERPLAAPPVRALAASTARTAAAALIATRFGSAAADLRIAAVGRAWVAPNGAFAADGLDAPAETLRLAWVVTLESRGSLADRLRSIEVWLDAGDGTVLGGDVVE
jgi:hypothetical protein